MANTFFKRPIWVTLGCLTISFIGFGVTYWINSEEEWPINILFFVIGLLGFFGFFEGLTAYMRLSSEDIRYRENFISKSISKNEIEKVRWEKGCGVFVFLRTGEWRRVPSININIQSVCNSIRAWLKKNA